MVQRPLLDRRFRAGVPMTEHQNTVKFNGIGQAREGKGHDAFAGVSYDRPNLTRLTDTRRFSITASGDFMIDDEIALSTAMKITSYLHSDNRIDKRGGSFKFEPGKPNFWVEILEPKDVDATIEKNILTAPGRPGSVDKGGREERGVRLAISPRQKVKRANIRIRMRINR